ncbi:MAG: hypothetical protein AAF490_32385 [Chloroflexota bacterium]
MSSTTISQPSESVPHLAPTIHLPIPSALTELVETTQLTEPQKEALRSFLALPVNTESEEIAECINDALGALEEMIPLRETAVQRAKKFDIYDEFFNVGRTSEHVGHTFIHGLLLTYANALKNMADAEHHMTVIEIPLLRVAVESTLQLFDLGEPA